MHKNEIKKLLSEKGKSFTVELKNGIILKKVKVEYMTETLVLFMLKSGEYKAHHPKEVIKVEQAYANV